MLHSTQRWCYVGSNVKQQCWDKKNTVLTPPIQEIINAPTGSIYIYISHLLTIWSYNRQIKLSEQRFCTCWAIATCWSETGSVGSAFASYAGSIPDRDKPKSYKQVVKTPLLNARQRVWVLHVLGDDHKKNECPYHSRHDTLKKRHYSMAMSAEYKSKIEALHR